MVRRWRHQKKSKTAASLFGQPTNKHQVWLKPMDGHTELHLDVIVRVPYSL